MSNALAILEARKELLVARASLQRLEAAHQIVVLRERVRLPRTAAALMANPQARSLVLATLAFALRRTRLLRFVRYAGLAFVVAQVVRSAAASRSANLPG